MKVGNLEPPKLDMENGCKITKEYSEKSVMVSNPFGMNFNLFESD